MHNFITVTGRRVDIAPMTGVHEKIVIAGMKSLQDSFQVGRRLFGQLVTPTPIWEHMYLGEEVDLLYLVRLASLRNMCVFSAKCPSCGKSDDYQVDIRNFRRTPYKCSNEECPCHDPELNNYSREAVTQNSNPRATIDWSRIPEDHLVKFPTKRMFTTDDGNNKIVGRPMLAKFQAEIGSWMQSESLDIITNSIAKMVVSIDEIEDRDNIEAILNTMTTWDRYQIRDYMADREGGVDNTVKITCTKCSAQSQATVPMSSSFFLRKQLRSKD